MHLQVLALGLKLPMMKFVRSILAFYKIAPSQLSGVVWRTVLRFEALCILSVPDVCQWEVFSAAYALRKSSQDARYFMPQSGCKKIIVNMVESDHGMRDTVIHVIGPWVAESKDECGVVPTI